MNRHHRHDRHDRHHRHDDRRDHRDHQDRRAGERAAELGALLRGSGLSISTAESLTGGLLGAAVTGTPGASAYYLGGAVTYATAAKASVLAVGEETLAARGPVSAETAEQMASGARELFGSSLAVSTTGVAGPAAQDGKPVGLVYLGLADAERVFSREFRSGGTTREEVRRDTVAAALALVIEYLRHRADRRH
ncbi:CinA family protein [Streptomyces zingiberis]|uniref:CinA family protein n=1 Tax=Streptomyces zingiberis TaxID=2053010 RepID=A0ABX1C5G4_9ACTN|nr:CinA family protein [Streptomyces zingiberis]NJQ03860.1 CinA family protein [Streptomyces zingiberis]